MYNKKNARYYHAKEMGIKAEFVILSGFSEFEFAQRAMSFGIRYYLLKPCGEKELGEVLERVQKDCAKRPRAAFPAPDPEASAPQKSQHFVDEIIEYVNQNLSDSRLSLKWIANNLVFRNEDYVGKAFAAHTGENFLTYLNRRRIQRAKELLEPGKDNKIYAVAEEIGLGHNTVHKGAAPQHHCRRCQRTGSAGGLFEEHRTVVDAGGKGCWG